MTNLVLLERSNALGLALLSQSGEDINRFVSLDQKSKVEAKVKQRARFQTHKDQKNSPL